MKRIKIFKVYFVLWLFVYFIAISNLEIFKLYFLSTLTFNIAIVSILAIGTFMLLRGAKDVVMLAGTFGVLIYKKSNLLFYIKGIEKVLPSNISEKIITRAKGNMLFFTQIEKEEILSWIDERFANQNKYNNFFIGTVLMIGLLGTFSGLLGAIGSMSNIVMSLSGNDINIGKIMAGFSGPLSSMAVGFGSSLFGVISAILLSIKGYLLNKSQAAVLDGVENWLNSKTVDSIMLSSDDSVSESNDIIEKQPSFIELFVQKMGELHEEIRELNSSNKVVQETLLTSVKEIHNLHKEQAESTKYLTESIKSLEYQTHSTIDKIDSLTDVIKENAITENGLLTELVTLQKDQSFNSINTNTYLEDLSYVIQESQKYSISQNNALVKELKNSKNDASNILLFQIAEHLENMQKELKKLNSKNEKRDKKESVDRYKNGGFLQKYLNKDESKVREE